MKNTNAAKRNPKSLANLRPPFSGQAGPGRPRLPEEVKIERKMFRELADSKVPRALERLAQAMESKDERNAIRACEIILAHTMPKLEELEIVNGDPAPGLTAAFAQALLAAVESGADHPVPAQN